MEVEAVLRRFDNVGTYLNRNTSILVRITLINEMLKGLRFCRYAELGCGDGSIALSLLDDKKKLVLVDGSPQMIERAKMNTPPALAANIDYVVKDIYAYESAERFDLIICVGVLAHVASIEQLISKLSSLLTEQGYLVVQITESHSVFGWLLYTFMSHADGYRMNRTSEAVLGPLLKTERFVLLDKTVYSDSSFGLSALSLGLGYRFKLLSARLNLPSLFSEALLLFQRASG